MKKSKILTLTALVLAVLFCISIGTAAGGDIPFSDVKADSWYYTYVADVYEAGIMKGKTETSFDPEGVVTRAEFVTAMARLAEADVTGLEDEIASFPDADVKAWYASYMGWGVKAGLVKGQGDGKLAPSAKLTRAELVTFMDRLMTLLDVTLIPDETAPKSFSDVKAGQYYTAPVEALRTTGLINGDGTGKFNPGDTSQRHSMAAIISRFLEKKAVADGYTKGLAEIRIVTETGRDVESKEEYIRASFSLTDDNGREIEADSMRIRGRGNSTWNMEKKSYRLKFDDNVCLMSKSSGGDTENKDWTLLANHCDKSLIRNHMAESLGRELDGIPWAPYTELVHVYLNGEYHGVYMLCEQVEVGDQRVDIEDGEKDDIGILIELDNYAEEEGEYLIDYVNIGGKMYSIKSDIKSKDQAIALKVHMETLMNVLREGDRAKIEAAVDIDSAVDMFLVHELMLNGDVGYSSFFMYLDSPHGKLHFTAPWDFDLSTGNTYQFTSPKVFHTAHETNEKGEPQGTVNYWFGALMSHQWFRELVRDRLNEKGEDLLRVIDDVTGYAYVNIDELDMNFDRWKVMNKVINQEPDNVVKLKNCAANIAFLKNWLGQRYDWMKEMYNSEWFIKDYDIVPAEDKTFGRTDLVKADVWTVPEWFGEYTQAQIIADTMRREGLVRMELGRAVTLTQENVERRVFVDQFGMEPGRFKFELNPDDFAALLSNYQGVGFDDAAHHPVRFKVIDTKTGEESTLTEYVFYITKRDRTEIW